jgi:predicted GNAT superfamily acetyltransferase
MPRGGADQVPLDLDAVEVVIPSDIEAVEARSFDEALGWRHASRRVFQRLLDGPYEVSGFIKGRQHGRYVVSRVAGR